MSSKVQDAAMALIKSKQSAISSSKASLTLKDRNPIMLVKKSDAKKQPKKQKEVKVISFSIANK